MQAVDGGDDGVSAHDDCQIRVNGLLSSGNSTGVCDVGDSVSHYERVLIKDCLGHDVYFLDTGEHSLRDSVVLSSAWRAVVLAGRDKASKPCTVRLENVFLRRMVGANDVRVSAGAAVEGRRLTLCGLNLLATGGTLSLSDSVIAGLPPPEITIAKETRWQARRNLYDARFVRYDTRFFAAKTFADYQQASGADQESQWTKVEFLTPLRGQLAAPRLASPVGVDAARLPPTTP